MKDNTKTILIITGMHRSGTSMISNYINHNGIFLGDNLLDTDIHNPKGYFEDSDFLDFQRNLLNKASKEGIKGWPDWGYTEDENLNLSFINEHKDSALDLINAHNNKKIWGWKDPRTSLLLNFWNELLPEAKFLLIYRNPWEVKRSIDKLNAKVFIDNPEYAYKIWFFYNQKLLEFYKANSEKCLLISANGFIHKPPLLIDLLIEKFKLNISDDKKNDLSFFSSDLFHSENTWKEYELFINHPRYLSLLNDLHSSADISGEKKNSPLLPGNPPKISIIIPCYNDGEYLEEAVGSIEKSLNKIYEIIIVNDGSYIKKTLEVLDLLEKKGFKIIHQINKGLAEARNVGIKSAKAPYILLLDADNKIEPDYFIKAITILDSDPQIGVVFSNPIFFGKETGFKNIPDFKLIDILVSNYIDACVILRKEAWLDSGEFDNEMRMGYEDWDLWISLSNKGWKFHHIDEYLFYYRRRYNSMVTKCNQPENRYKLIKYIAEKHNNIYSKYSAEITANLHQHLAIRDIIMNDLNEQIRLKDNHICNLEDVKRILEGETNRQVEIKSKLEEHIHLKDNHIGNLEEQIHSKDNHIGNLEEQIHSKDNHVGNLEEQIHLKDNHINNLGEHINLKDNHISNLEDEIRKREAQKIKNRIKKAFKKLKNIFS